MKKQKTKQRQFQDLKKEQVKLEYEKEYLKEQTEQVIEKLAKVNKEKLNLLKDIYQPVKK
jgi:hypothetical protein